MPLPATQQTITDDETFKLCPEFEEALFETRNGRFGGYPTSTNPSCYLGHWVTIGFWCCAWWRRTPLASSAWQKDGMLDGGGGGAGDGDKEELDEGSGARVDVVGNGGGDGLRRSPL